MNNKAGWIISLLMVIAIVGLTSCTTAGPQSASTTSSTPTVNQTAPVNVNINNQEGIWVTGQGIVTVTPNIANLSLGVSAQAARVADAQSQSSAAMAKVMTALTGNGVDPKDISTQYYSINQTSRYDNATQQSIITGYQVTNMVNVKIRSIDKVGIIIDAVAAAGGDLTRINSISFSVDNPSQYYSQARTLAMNDAKSKAQQLASLAGVTLGRTTYINENSTSTPGPYAVQIPAASLARAADTSISPGQTDVTLYVQVAYSIQ